MNGWLVGCMDGWTIDKWMDDWLDELNWQIDGWVNG